MGVWGQRWARGDVQGKHHDASLLMWDIHRSIRADRLPPRRVVVQFHLRGSSDKKSRFWLVLDRGTADICLIDPGFEVDVHVEGHVRTMVDYWMGHVEFADAVACGDLQVDGPRGSRGRCRHGSSGAFSRPSSCRPERVLQLAAARR